MIKITEEFIKNNCGRVISCSSLYLINKSIDLGYGSLDVVYYSNSRTSFALFFRDILISKSAYKISKTILI